MEPNYLLQRKNTRGVVNGQRDDNKDHFGVDLLRGPYSSVSRALLEDIFQSGVFRMAFTVHDHSIGQPDRVVLRCILRLEIQRKPLKSGTYKPFEVLARFCAHF